VKSIDISQPKDLYIVRRRKKNSVRIDHHLKINGSNQAGI